MRACLNVEELRRLQLGQTAPQLERARFRDGLEEREGHRFSDDRRRLQQVLDGRGQPVDPGSEYGLNGSRNLDRVQGLGEAEGSTGSNDHPGFDERAHALLEEERIALRAVDEQALEWLQRRSRANEIIEKHRRALGRQGVDPQLRVIALTTPGMLILGAVVDEQEQAGAWKAVDDAVE